MMLYSGACHNTNKAWLHPPQQPWPKLSSSLATGERLLHKDKDDDDGQPERRRRGDIISAAAVAQKPPSTDEDVFGRANAVGVIMRTKLVFGGKTSC